MGEVRGMGARRRGLVSTWILWGKGGDDPQIPEGYTHE